jgi:IS1 family transposase
MGYPKDYLLCLISLYYDLWGNILAKFPHSDSIFRLQKGIIRVVMGARTRDCCRELYKILQILSLTFQYIYSLALFVVNNKSLCMENSQLRNVKSENNSSF